MPSFVRTQHSGLYPELPCECTRGVFELSQLSSISFSCMQSLGVIHVPQRNEAQLLPSSSTGSAIRRRSVPCQTYRTVMFKFVLGVSKAMNFAQDLTRYLVCAVTSFSKGRERKGKFPVRAKGQLQCLLSLTALVFGTDGATHGIQIYTACSALLAELATSYGC